MNTLLERVREINNKELERTFYDFNMIDRSIKKEIKNSDLIEITYEDGININIRVSSGRKRVKNLDGTTGFDWLSSYEIVGERSLVNKVKYRLREIYDENDNLIWSRNRNRTVKKGFSFGF